MPTSNSNPLVLAPIGPQFGVGFVEILADDDNKSTFQLEVFPDSNNELLKANGLAMHFYFMPKRVYLAKKQDQPADFEFAATVFKGLMTTENTVGITDDMTVDGVASAAGGFCTFSTTFAIPDSVIKNGITQLQQQSYSKPAAFSKFSSAFNVGPQDPTPFLGIVPIIENDVTIEVPHLQSVGNAQTPFFIDAQGTGKGSIEASGINAFLVTMNMLSAGAIVGSLQAGASPFTVHYNMKQQFYMNACDVTIHVDMSKMYDAVSAAVSVNYMGIASANLSEAWSQCITSGAITTEIKMGAVDVDPDLKKLIDTQVDNLQKTAFDAVKSDIFDFHPTSTPAATSGNSLVGVSVKAQQDRRTDKFDLRLHIDSAVVVNNTSSGTLNDLEPAIKANLDKYLAIVDIGKFFQKVQIAATNNVSWSEKLPDGTDLSDPIKSISYEAAYPDFATPLNADKTPHLMTQAQGFHYTIGHKDPKGGSQLAAWTKDNPNDVINISFLRLDHSVDGWDSDQVQITKTIVYDGSDPRVEISGNKTTFQIVEKTKDHAPVVTAEEVGYVFVHFLVDRPLPENITLTLVCTIGQRKDTFTITRANQKNIIWEIFSDKYVNANSFQYDLQVEVVGANFTDDPVIYGTPQSVKVDLPTGRIKYINSLILHLPQPTAGQVSTINSYIKAFQAPVSAPSPAPAPAPAAAPAPSPVQPVHA